VKEALLRWLQVNLGRNMKVYDFMGAPIIEKQLDRLCQRVNRQSPHGEVEWQMRVSEGLGLESTPRPSGRPKKRKGSDKK
jgi:hypothetical protein